VFYVPTTLVPTSAAGLSLPPAPAPSASSTLPAQAAKVLPIRPAVAKAAPTAPANLGEPLNLDDEQLAAAANITDADVAAAGGLWSRTAPEPVADLLEAEAV